jgi:glycosyltransferase involved in cell wall biosynthesis
VVEDGVSGYIVDSMDEAVEAVYRARELDRRAVRGWFERRFSVERMTDDYLRVYRRLAMAQRRPASIVEGAYV